MKLMKAVLVGFGMVMFCACSQTVSGSNDGGQDSEVDEFIPGFNAPPSEELGETGGSSGSGKPRSSSSTGSVRDDSSDSGSGDEGSWGGDEDWFSDFGGDSGESSGMDVTQYLPDQKMDCTFSIDDDVWQFEAAEADSSVDITLKFKDNGDLWMDIVSEAPVETEEECEENAALIAFFGMMAAASDETDMIMSASCEGKMFRMKVQGTADEKYTPEQKSEMYGRLCK